MLVGSLLLLSQIGTTVIFPNAIAIADYDNTDQYMKDAQDMTNKIYYKSQSNDLIQKIKCNNINANLNGINANIGSGLIDGDTTDANGEVLAAQGSEALSVNDDKDFVDRANNFSFKCINNNDNTVVEGEEPISKLCEECFAANSTLQRTVIDFLTETENPFLETGFTEDSTGQLISEAYVIGAQINTLERLCNQIENAAETLSVPASDETIRKVIEGIVFFQTGNTTGFESSIDALIECLLEKGIIVDRDLP